MSEVRSISITGGAAADYTGGVRKRRRTSKKEQTGGSTATATATATTTPIVGLESVKSIALRAQPVDTPALKYPSPDVPPVIRVAGSQPIAPHQQGGAKQIKVELKKKLATKKVQLHPKKAEAPKPSLAKKHQTRKIRKVTIGLSSLHKRMTRAKKVQKKVKEMPLDKLKEHLISKKLIKPTSKAPESVLRQIAADSQIVAEKSL